MFKLKVLIRGAGEMATGVAWRLNRCGFQVLMTEIPKPLAVRRGVCFSEAVYEGEKVVEGVKAVLISHPEEGEEVWKRGEVAVIVDPEARCLQEIRPQVLVDAIMAKRNLGTRKDQAPLVIGLGPGFRAGEDVHAVIETKRGHDLGRVLWEGEAQPNTGIPGEIGGYTVERVLRAPKAGVLRLRKDIGDRVEAGEEIGWVRDEPIRARISGVIRGLLREGSEVQGGLKIGDIDPRGVRDYCFTISDKARAIAGGVLEAILFHFNR